jgi:hypothetical protein
MGTTKNQIRTEVSCSIENGLTLGYLLLEIEIDCILGPEDKTRMCPSDFLGEGKIMAEVSLAVLRTPTEVSINRSLNDGNFHRLSGCEGLREPPLAVEERRDKDDTNSHKREGQASAA